MLTGFDTYHKNSLFIADGTDLTGVLMDLAISAYKKSESIIF